MPMSAEHSESRVNDGLLNPLRILSIGHGPGGN